MEEYLKCTVLIDYDQPAVRDKARELTGALRTNKEKAVALFYFVRDSIRFNPYSPGHLLELNRASAVLARGHGFCYQKAIVLAAMARSSGIPTRLRFADIRNHLLSREFTEMMGGSNVLVYHGCDEFLLDGKWVAATPAYDLKLCRDNGYIPVEFDGENDARLHKHAADGRLHIEYIRDHGHRPDLPWEEILRARDEFVAGLGMEVADFMARWEQISKSD